MVISDEHVPFLLLFAAFTLTLAAHLATLTILVHLYRHILEYRDPLDPSPIASRIEPVLLAD